MSDKGGGKEFPPCPQGLHPARCYYVYHLGLQPDNFKGVPRWVEKCMIGFEFPTHKLVFDEKEGPMPYTLGMPFTASLGEKSNLRKTLVAWRGRPFSEAELKAFDISKVVGAPALVQVIHEQKLKDGKTKAFAKIANVLPLPPEMKALLPPAIHKPLLYKIEDGNGGQFSELPRWIQEMIAKAKDFKIIGAPETHAPMSTDQPSSPPEEDAPF